MTTELIQDLSTKSPPRVAPEFPQTISESAGEWLVLCSSGPLATQFQLWERFNIWSYVPVRQFRKLVNGSRNGWGTEPLFRGYLFARADEMLVNDAKHGRLVWGSVEVKNQQQLTDELLAVELMLAINPRVEFATGILPGSQVEILDGAYRGCTGHIIRKDDRDLFAVLLETLGGAVMTDVSPARMQLLD